MSAQSRVCPHCGKKLASEAASYCSHCGEALSLVQDQAPNTVPMERAPKAIGDKFEVEVSESDGVAVGAGAQAIQAGEVRGAVIQAQGAIQGNIITADTVMIQHKAAVERRASRKQIVPPPEYYISRPNVETQLESLLSEVSSELNLVELYGLPGIGKTMLGRYVAFGLGERYPDGMLWVDVENKTEMDILAALIEPFETLEVAFRESWQYLEVLQTAIGEQRVLIVFNRLGDDDEERLHNVLPRACPNTAILLISTAHLPTLVPIERSVYMGEMAPDGAESLFRRVWGDAFTSTPSSLVRDLAAELGFLPTQIVLVARDILNRQITPADYLVDLRQQKEARGFRPSAKAPGLQAVYENLPPRGQAVLPFIGIVGAGEWDLDTLTAVSQLKRRDVEVGLRQIKAAGFLRRGADDGCRCSPMVRDFALIQLEEQGGETLVRSARAVMAHHSLRRALETTRRFRQDLIDDFISDKARKDQFLATLQEAFLPAEVISHHGDTSVTIQTGPGLGDLDLVQEAFERVVLVDPEYLARWTELLNSETCIEQKRHLGNALMWAIEREDWSLARRFSFLSIGAFISELRAAGEERKSSPVTIKGFSFGPLRNLDLKYAALDSSLRAARLIDPKLTSCELVTTRWAGVRLYRPSLVGVDMVNASMPGLVVQDGTFVDVDARRADLRGAVFYNCHFLGVKFRSANLSGADFISCGGVGMDLRDARFDGASFHKSAFKDVTYYEAEEAKFKPELDSEHPTGPLRGRVADDSS